MHSRATVSSNPSSNTIGNFCRLRVGRDASQPEFCESERAGQDEQKSVPDSLLRPLLPGRVMSDDGVMLIRDKETGRRLIIEESMLL